MDGAGRSKESSGATPLSPSGAEGPPGLGWLPARVRDSGGGLMLDWVHFGARRLTEPFYEDSVARARGDDPGPLVSTPLADLTTWTNLPPHLEPTGLIFHMSRCGSTLASQMLAACGANIVVSEASPIDAAVRLEAGDDADRVRLLRAMVAALGQVRNVGETRYFLKLDSWHACALPLFRAAFPDTPWAFVYREPAAVMVSHVRRTGMQMVSDLVPPGFYELDPGGQTWGEDYFAQVLGAICAAVVREYPAGGGLLLNYDELPDALWTRLLPHFGVTPPAAELAAMAAAARFDAKSPGELFRPDAGAKRQAATASIVVAVERRLTGVYRQLEALRGVEACVENGDIP
jgi:hypothetical protein